METGKRNELELVAHGPQLALELGDSGVVQLGLPVEGRRAVIGEELAGMDLVDGFGKAARVVEVGVRGLPPQ